MSASFEQWSLSVGSGWGMHQRTVQSDRYRYVTLNVVTPHGIVWGSISAGHLPRMNRTSLMFVHNGRQYRRTWRRTYSERYVVTLAKRFAREIMEGQS